VPRPQLRLSSGQVLSARCPITQTITIVSGVAYLRSRGRRSTVEKIKGCVQAEKDVNQHEHVYVTLVSLVIVTLVAVVYHLNLYTVLAYSQLESDAFPAPSHGLLSSRHTDVPLEHLRRILLPRTNLERSERIDKSHICWELVRPHPTLHHDLHIQRPGARRIVSFALKRPGKRRWKMGSVEWAVFVGLLSAYVCLTRIGSMTYPKALYRQNHHSAHLPPQRFQHTHDLLHAHLLSYASGFSLPTSLILPPCRPPLRPKGITKPINNNHIQPLSHFRAWIQFKPRRIQNRFESEEHRCPARLKAHDPETRQTFHDYGFDLVRQSRGYPTRAEVGGQSLLHEMRDVVSKAGGQAGEGRAMRCGHEENRVVCFAA